MQATAIATGKPTPEDRELAVRLGALMLHVFSTEGGSVLRAIDDAGLNLVQMKALIATTTAETAGDPHSVKSIAENLGVSVPSASRAVDHLVDRKLVTRTEDPGDRRVKRVAPTAKGRSVTETLMAARLRGLERFAAGLSDDERQALDTALDTLLEREEIAAVYSNHLARTHSRKAAAR